MYTCNTLGYTFDFDTLELNTVSSISVISDSIIVIILKDNTLILLGLSTDKAKLRFACNRLACIQSICLIDKIYWVDDTFVCILQNGKVVFFGNNCMYRCFLDDSIDFYEIDNEGYAGDCLVACIPQNLPINKLKAFIENEGLECSNSMAHLENIDKILISKKWIVTILNNRLIQYYDTNGVPININTIFNLSLDFGYTYLKNYEDATYI